MKTVFQFSETPEPQPPSKWQRQEKKAVLISRSLEQDQAHTGRTSC